MWANTFHIGNGSKSLSGKREEKEVEMEKKNKEIVESLTIRWVKILWDYLRGFLFPSLVPRFREPLKGFPVIWTFLAHMVLFLIKMYTLVFSSSLE